MGVHLTKNKYKWRWFGSFGPTGQVIYHQFDFPTKITKENHRVKNHMLDKEENSNEIPADAVSETFKVHALTVMPGLNLFIRKNKYFIIWDHK